MEVNGRHYDTNPTPALVIDRIENDWMHAPTVYPMHVCREPAESGEKDE